MRFDRFPVGGDSTGRRLSAGQPLGSDRREFLRAIGGGAVGLVAESWARPGTILGAQPGSAGAAAAAVPPLNRFPRMMQEWLVDQVRAAEARGNARREALRTAADAEAYVKSVRERIRESFGPFPDKTPLQPRVTGVVERDVYRIEKVIFESRPEYLVTGSLYLPTGRAGPFPGVVGVCGHSTNGGAAEAYQSFAQGLARQGYACFIIDPVGQGERFQFLTDGLKSRLGGGVAEHIQMGNVQTLVGEFLGMWFAWDGIRALDYLLTRPEVDPRHVGVTGNSGGGTQTTWLCGLESRFTMAAPACFVTTFRRNAENELPADTEQCPPKVLALELDHSDFLAALAPKPVIILAQEKDYFDARGSAETYQRLKQLYTLLGQPDNIRLHIGPDHHGYSQPNREAMYRFFHEVTGASQAQTEPAITIEQDETLWCTPRGQVAELGSRTLMSFTRDKARQLAQQRSAPRGDALRAVLRDVLRWPAVAAPDPLGQPPDYRILRGAGNRRYPGQQSCTYVVETEPRIAVLLTRLHDDRLMSRLPRSDARAVLYVAHRSADAELRDEPLVRELLAAEPAAAFYACDVRGIGDSQPNTCGVDQFLRPYGSHYFYAAHGLMLDRPLLGLRTWDVWRLIQLLKAAGHRDVHLAGRGWGALPAAFAAILSADVAQVTLKHALSSFTALIEDEDQQWPYAVMLPNVLAHFDLPDCYAELASKQLRHLEPWGSQDGMS